MIVYKKSKTNFLEDIDDNQITDIISRFLYSKLGINVGESEKQSWNNSLPIFANVIRNHLIPDSIGVGVEYSIPRTKNRIDVVLTGKNQQGEDTLLVVELKQWSKAELTSLDGVVKTRFRHGLKETLHPSYQAWSYTTLFENFNEVVYDGKVKVSSCVYLHNYEKDGVLDNAFYESYTNESPLFFKSDNKKLREYIATHISSGEEVDILELVDTADIRPSKKLSEVLSSMIKGNKEFTLIDEQKLVFESAKALVSKSQSNESPKQVLLIRGGPGTGESVVAINLLVALTKSGWFTQYVTRNAAPRTVYEAKLTGHLRKSQISQLFKGSGSYYNSDLDSIDVLLIDEAHRLNEKSGMFSHLGENQVKELIQASRVSVFFLDEDQKVTLKDIGSEAQITEWAKHFGAEMTVMDLVSQFRCDGSDGYLAWLDQTLGIRETANNFISSSEYDFKVFDDPSALYRDIKELNDIGKQSRLLAGYCWKWKSKSDSKSWKVLNDSEKKACFDISFPEYDFNMRWNLTEQGQGWLMHPESINEIGCIHTCQGLEMDYAGVILGNDFLIRNNKVVIDPSAHPGSDKAIQGWKQLLKDSPEDGKNTIETIIKNTYRVLMSRGMKGCYLFSEDEETREYFRSKVK